MKNLLLISLDTLRADVGYSGKFPAIESLRKESTTFLNTVSSSPLTPISHATVFTGLQPYNHGVRHLVKEQLPSHVKTIAERMKEAKFRTGAIVSCPGMNRWYGHSRGFDSFDDEIPLMPDGSDPLKSADVKMRGTALKRANVVAQRGIELLNELASDTTKPFFLLLHFFDAHWPYEAPEKFGGANPYEEEVAFSCHYLESVFAEVKRLGIWDDTTIIVFSDHGEDLEGWYPNDKGGAKLGHPEEAGHGCLLYQQTQKVILLIKDPLFPMGRSFEQQVRLVDIAPTIAKIFQLPAQSSQFDGISLTEVVSGRIVTGLPGYCETLYPSEQNEVAGNPFPNATDKKAVIFDNRFKIITHFNSELIEIFDLQNDPNELTNLAAKLRTQIA